MMAFVMLRDDVVCGLLGMAQPDIPSCTEISDDDPRLIAYLTLKSTMENQPAVMTEEPPIDTRLADLERRVAALEGGVPSA
jgi:hypothetical protein